MVKALIDEIIAQTIHQPTAQGGGDNPRRILMTADTVGGVWSYVLELAAALAPHDFQIALATMGPAPSELQRAEADRHPNIELFVSEYKLEWMDDPWHDVAAAGEWLLALEEKWRPDLIHINGYAHAALPWRAPVMVVAHSCVYSWFEAVRGETPPEEQWARYRDAVRRGLAAADLVVAPSTEMLRALVRHYGELEPGRTRVIYNARTPERFAPRAKQPFVFCAGRVWDEAKNVCALARIAPQLTWPIFVAGDQKEPGKPEDCGLGDITNFHLLGEIGGDSMTLHFGEAAIYALPAQYEPFGLSALEAGLAGCALILGDIPTLREIWGDAALFVDPADDGALAEAIQYLIRRPLELEEYGQRARARALRYTPERMTQSYLLAYRQAAAAERHTRRSANATTIEAQAV